MQLTLAGMDMDVVGVATSGAQALDAVREHRPDVVLMDIGLPDQSGIVVGQRILEERPETKVVALTALEDAQAVREALRVGFCGYLTKDTDAHRFERALRSVFEGQVVLPQSLGKELGADRSPSADDMLIRQLTPRELEVLELLAEGATSLRIAETLGVSPNTVRTHVQGILSKLQVHSRLEAAAFAVRHGLVDVGT
jgi:two-component system, NarL family, nitrate/nitrite response regulator NarL